MTTSENEQPKKARPTIWQWLMVAQVISTIIRAVMWLVRRSGDLTDGFL